MRIWPSLAFLTLILLGCSTQGGSQSNGSGEPASQQNNNTYVTAPIFNLVDLNGKKFSLADFKGKVVFLDFWATWCPPCVMSIPEVEKLSADYKNKNVEFVSLSVDREEEVVQRFLARHQISIRVAMANGVDEKYRVSGIPVFFVIDREGKITNAWEGFHPRMALSWRKELDRLL